MNDDRENFEDLELRLKTLRPMEQEILAAKIMADWLAISREVLSVSSEDSPMRQPVDTPHITDALAAPRRRFAPLALRWACVGAVAGAAATFLAMAFLVPPKIEIREVIREVSVKTATASGAGVKPDARPAAGSPSSPADSGTGQLATQPQSRHDFDAQLARSGFPDLDALIAQQEALVRRMSRAASADESWNWVVPRRISPEEYRELLRELKL
jgi:hypothetical protein